MRRAMTHPMATEAEADAALKWRLDTMASVPPMWPITDIRVERRLAGSAIGPDRYKWVVAGDYSAWP